ATLMVEILKDAPRGGARLRRDRHAVGEARRADRAGLRQVNRYAVTDPFGRYRTAVRGGADPSDISGLPRIELDLLPCMSPELAPWSSTAQSLTAIQCRPLELPYPISRSAR